jgi:hypothetical protein
MSAKTARAFIKAHNRRMCARALKNQRQEQSDHASGGLGERRLHLLLVG